MNRCTHKRVYIGMGANLDRPRAQLEKALTGIDAIETTVLKCCSPWYGSKAIGPGKQPDYVNGVCEISTELSPDALLMALQAIEAKQGRKRGLRWRARPLDLDILWYDHSEINSDTLSIPHPRINERAFVLFPWRDIAPDLPVTRNQTVSDMAKCLATDGAWQLALEINREYSAR